MFLKNYYKSILIILFFLFLSLFPADKTPKIQFINIPHFDKLVHFGMYFILSIVLIIDLNKNTKNPIKKFFLSVILFVFIFSGLLEIIQELIIPGRFGSLVDLAANLLGSVIGLYISILLYKSNRFIF